jgi:hypothetical protein
MKQFPWTLYQGIFNRALGVLLQGLSSGGWERLAVRESMQQAPLMNFASHTQTAETQDKTLGVHDILADQPNTSMHCCIH